MFFTSIGFQPAAFHVVQAHPPASHISRKTCPDIDSQFNTGFQYTSRHRPAESTDVFFVSLTNISQKAADCKHFYVFFANCRSVLAFYVI